MTIKLFKMRRELNNCGIRDPVWYQRWFKVSQKFWIIWKNMKEVCEKKIAK